MKRVEIKCVYAHPRVAGEARALGLSIEEVAGLLLRFWDTVRTAGSKVRALRYTPGNDYRLRIGDTRFVFSVGESSAFVHLGERRDSIYDSDSFRLRIEKFAAAARSDISDDSGLAAAIRYASVAAGRPPISTAQDVSIGYELRPQQRTFFSAVLPLKGADNGVAPKLVVGYGPPGAGKTVVGLEMAIEAVLDGHAVDIVVPSDQLQHRYLDDLRAASVPLVEKHCGHAAVRVLRCEAWFADRAAVHVAFDREARVLELVREALRRPAVKAQLNSLSQGKLSEDRLHERLPVLVDALLTDEDWWKGFDLWRIRGRDSMIDSVVGYLELLQKLRSGIGEILDTGGGGDFQTRSELALLPAADAWRPARLTIVDEAQDLAPAEWRTLLDSAFKCKANDDRVVLLGDMRQRINLVPFAWSDIKTHASQSCSIAPDQMCEMNVDTESYRMRQAVARAALSVFDRRVRGADASRAQGGKLDVDKLAPGGHVRVAVVDPKSLLLEQLLRERAPKAGLDTTQYLFCVHGYGSGRELAGVSGLFNHSIKAAKGLEATSIVVNMPFGRSSRRPGKFLEQDEATEFYTAVSRARERLLLVVDQATWNFLARADEFWLGADVRFSSQITPEWLRNALDELVEKLTPAEIVDRRMRQLEEVCQSRQLDSTDCLGQIEEALAAISKWGDDELIPDIARCGVMLAAANRGTFDLMRDRIRSRLHDQSVVEQVLNFLFLGEFGVASQLAQAKMRGSGAWDSEVLTMVAEDSPIQAWLLHRAAHVESTWSEEVAAPWIARELASRLGERAPRESLGTTSTLTASIQTWTNKYGALARGAADERVAQTASRLITHIQERLSQVERHAIAGARASLEEAHQRSAQGVDRLERIVRAGGGIL